MSAGLLLPTGIVWLIINEGELKEANHESTHQPVNPTCKPHPNNNIIYNAL